MALDAFESAYSLSLWNGLPVSTFEAPAGKLRDALPDFELRPFGEQPNDNPRMRMIVRMPHGSDGHERPVAAVSDRYELLQHRVVASWLGENIAESELKDATARVTITEYGERIRITIRLAERLISVRDPEFRRRYNVDDLYAPEIEITNSVDRSTAFRVSIRWRRLICLNGMFTVEQDRMRSVHHVDFSRTKLVRDFMESRLARHPDVLTQLQKWKRTKVTKAAAQSWCEEHLRKEGRWPVETCARLWAILETGYDGTVTPPARRGERHALSDFRVGQHRRVLGAPFPIETAYDLAQLLTWITSNHRTVEMQVEGAEEVPRLMRSFLAARKR